MGPSVYFKGMRCLDEPGNPYRQLYGFGFCRFFDEVHICCHTFLVCVCVWTQYIQAVLRKKP